MKKNGILLPVLAIFFATLLIAFMPTDAEASLYDDTIRLHIIAQSDSDEEQELKLKIRDALLLEYSTALTKGKTRDEAEKNLRELLPQIKSFCEEKISEYGYSYAVDVELLLEWYDTREYEDFTLPCGTYTSLKIIIGDGEGKNWWCVMYPPLCLDLATENAPADDGIGKYTDEEFTLISGEKYNIKFKLLELFSSAFS